MTVNGWELYIMVWTFWVKLESSARVTEVVVTAGGGVVGVDGVVGVGGVVGTGGVVGAGQYEGLFILTVTGELVLVLLALS